jgi:hypothetical protein
MTRPTRIEPAERPAGNILASRYAQQQHAHDIHDGHRRQRERREALAIRRDDDDPDAA